MSQPKEGRTKMFTAENTNGFTDSDLELLNAALTVLVADGIEEKNASDIINNNWQESGNTIESLTAL
jgi:hypothetical protein